jgi:hypothetical protein
MIVVRWIFLALAAAVAGLAGHVITTHARGGPTVPGMAPPVSVHGNHLIGRNGQVLRLAGVNRSGAEYACAEGWGIWDGPTDTDSAVKAMTGWRINAVRLPLNEACWLGINGVKAAYSGHNYRSAIADYVGRLPGLGLERWELWRGAVTDHGLPRDPHQDLRAGLPAPPRCAVAGLRCVSSGGQVRCSRRPRGSPVPTRGQSISR